MGSIRKVTRKGGTSYEARIHRGTKEISQTFRDIASARKWVNATETKIDKRENVSRAAEKLLFKDMCAEFVRDYVDENGKPCSAMARSMAPRLATHFDEDTTIAAITRNKIVGYIPALQLQTVPESDKKKKPHPLYKGGGGGGRTYSRNTARKYYMLLRQVLQWASLTHDFTLDHRLFVKIGVPGSWEKPRERRLEVDNDEEARLIASGLRSQANGKQWRLIILFAIETTARVQEMLLAQWKEFNIAKREWNIPAEHTKTGKARTALLSVAALALIDELAAFRKKPKEPANRLDPNELVFPWWKDSSTLSKAFKRLTARAEIEDFRFHDLRHEGISRLFLTAMSDVEIMKMTGHTNFSTLERYAALRSKDTADKRDTPWQGVKKVTKKKPIRKKAPTKKSRAP